MDPDSPITRVERNFWTVWYYITGAVNRFFRPEPIGITSNDPNSIQESAVDSEPANSGHAEGDAGVREVDEEQPLVTASLLSSSRPLVAWELCTTDIDLGPDEESTQHTTQQGRGSESKASEEGEGLRDDQIARAGNDDAGLFIVKDARAKECEKEENGDQKLCTGTRNEYEEHANAQSLRLTGDAVNEDVEERGGKAGAEEETEKPVTLDDPQKMAETMRNIQVKEADDKKQQEDEKDLEVEDIEVKSCPITDLSLEEATVQRNETDTAVMREEVDVVPQLPSDNESDEGVRQAENLLSVCEELSDDQGDFKGDPGFTSLHAELQMACNKSVIMSEDELIVVEQEHVMAPRSESDKVEDGKEEEDESALDEKAVIEEENVDEATNNQTIDEAPEQENNIKTVTEEEEDISTELVTWNENVLQNAKAELHTAEFTTGEEEDVAKNTEVHNKTREADDGETETHGTVINEKSDVTTTHISVDERFFDKDLVEEERLSSEEGNKEGYMACTSTSVMVKPEGETGQEMSSEFKNIPLGICEGRVVVSQELNSPTCEETQVPEYNNEPEPDENTTQRFLEDGDCKEIQGSQLPEEVESKEPESLQTSGCSTGADDLLVREHMDEEQESTQDGKNSFDSVVEEHAGILRLTDTGLPQKTEKPPAEAVIQGSGHLFEEEEGELQADSVKTGIENSETDFESDFGLTDKSNKAIKESQDGTEELLINFEIDEGLCDSKVAVSAGDGCETTGAVAAADETSDFLKAEGEKMTETSVCQESVSAINSEQNSTMTPSLLEGITEFGFLKHSDEIEPKLLEDVEMQDAVVEGTGYGVEEEVAEDEMQNKTEMEILHLRAPEVAESGLSRPVGSLEMKNQLSDEALEINNEEMLTEAAGESVAAESEPKNLILISTEEMAKRVTESEGSYTKETVSSISGRQDVIDEDILDLWIQTALSEDADDIQQDEELELGQQMETEPSHEDQGEISSDQTEKDKEQLVESDLMSDTELSSSTAESGFSDQSLCEWGTQSSETRLLKSTSPGSFQGIYDMLANTSESAQHSKSQDILMEETAETGQSDLKQEESITERGFHHDSGVTSPETGDLNQESDKSREETDEVRVEPVETETGSQKEIDAEVAQERKTDWEDAEEADFKSEKSKAEDETLEIIMSDSPDEVKHTESGRSRSGSEASSEEEIALTRSGSQGNTCTESERKLLRLPSLDKPQSGWSEDIAQSSAGDEVAERLTTKSKDQMEVDVSVLDFTVQRSRIAVKNPRVRRPKDPRSLLHMPSVDPTPSSHLPTKAHAGVPLGGLGIGIKLPGLGAGFPVLKKTQPLVREENSPETLSQETKPEEKSDSPKQDVAQHKPKWMPPRHPGFGNPLMSELKTKLKKTTKE